MDSAESFDAYVAARYPALVRFGYVLTGSHHDAEDLVQGALLKAVPRWRRIADAPEPYLRRIMVNDNISRWRRHRDREVSVATPPDRAVVPAPEADDLLVALRALGPRQRTVIVLRFYEDLTERQTAELMGISVGTVKSHTREALTRLRALVPDLADSLPVG